jgi:hypothetical protein
MRESHDELSTSKPYQYTTTLKLIQIMSEKALLTRIAEDRSNVYRPAIPRDHVRQTLPSPTHFEVSHGDMPLRRTYPPAGDLLAVFSGNRKIMMGVSPIPSIVPLHLWG